MKNIRCLILEDEKPAQGILEKYIGELPNLELAGTYTNPLSAMEQIQSEKIDLIFLDINLPKISGINFLKSLKNPPAVIITTAYPEYALEGYELNVVDYLLKPISFERFLKAISKLEPELEIEPATSAGGEQSSYQNGYTFEKADNTIYKIEYRKIRYLESDRDYVKVIADDDDYLFRQSLKYWETILPEEEFSRVHKSYIVNVSKIDRISGNRIISGEDIIPIGRNYKEAFLEKINNMN